MRILVSACLIGGLCKYNGKSNSNERVRRYLEGAEIIAVCPEVMGGLPIPRTPAEIVDGIVTTRDGRDVDAAFRRGAAMALDLALKKSVDLAILQSRSPSCGVRQVYDGTFSGKKIKGRGVLAEALVRAGVPVVDEKELLSGRDAEGLTAFRDQP